MTRVPFPVLALLCVVASTSAGEPPLRVTVRQLLITPEKFVGKRVVVTGISETLADWSSPEINHPLTLGNVAKFRHRLVTGEDTFTPTNNPGHHPRGQTS